jgi:glycosyltransferase involved in cell wall biosynthesis
MKPPDHPTPSGDRQIARLLLEALKHRGHDVWVASRFRSRDGVGDPRRQARLGAIGARLAQRLVRFWQRQPGDQRPELWLTYHLYHKAPDWLGPGVADALRIPYVVVEASVASRQASGPWAVGYAAARAALARANALVCLNPDDEDGLRRLLGEAVPLHRLPPFLNHNLRPAASTGRRRRARLASRLRLDPRVPWLVVVAMMRHGDKLASYTVLAKALAPLRQRRWSLLVIGDGEARRAVQAALAPLGRERVRYLGQLQPERVGGILAACDLMPWPAINEAFGMALLEAQVAGVPVVAGRERGVAQVVADRKGGLLVPVRSALALRRAVVLLLNDPARRRRLAVGARRWARRERGIADAGARLEAILQSLLNSACT